jgi:hypothetical protein
MPATPSQSAPAAPLADRHAARAEAVVAIHARLSRLDTVRIDGTPVGDCTVQQVRDWAERRRFDQRTAARDVRFALSLIGANLNRNEIIRRWIKPDEADELYRRAEEVANAA